MDKLHPLLNESNQTESFLSYNLQSQMKNSVYDTKELYLEEDNDVSYSQPYNNPKNYQIFLELVNVRNLSNLLNKHVKDDSYFLILNVRYKKDSNDKLYSWEIMKSYHQIKELLFQVITF